MAIDTRQKRSSAIGLLLPWRGMLPVADGTVSQADRQQLAGLYSGIPVGGVVMVGRRGVLIPTIPPFPGGIRSTAGATTVARTLVPSRVVPADRDTGAGPPYTPR